MRRTKKKKELKQRNYVGKSEEIHSNPKSLKNLQIKENNPTRLTKFLLNSYGIDFIFLFLQTMTSKSKSKTPSNG